MIKLDLSIRCCHGGKCNSDQRFSMGHHFEIGSRNFTLNNWCGDKTKDFKVDRTSGESPTTGRIHWYRIDTNVAVFLKRAVQTVLIADNASFWNTENTARNCNFNNV